MLLSVVLALSALWCGAVAYPTQDRVTSLPGYNGPALSMYSGYIPVGGSRKLFYWAIEAQENVANAPLVFWYQGGPGCSGLAGLLTEHGPLVANAAGGLDYNPISWTRFATVVYLEQPAFVGYSYSDDPLDHASSDSKAANDNLVFVTRWLEAFPAYKNRPTWFTGESYGGVYVPTLTAKALADRSTQIYKQLVGVMVGNGVQNCGSSTLANQVPLFASLLPYGSRSLTCAAQFNLYYWHGLVSYSDYAAFAANGCLSPSGGNSNCDTIFSNAQDKIGVIDQELMRKRSGNYAPSLDPDDLYQDFCTGNASLSVTNVIPQGCKSSGDLTTAYLRRSDVHRALHASGPFGLYTEIWSICSSKILYTSSGAEMAPLYRAMKTQKPGFQILIYSGDVDIATVPFSTTNPCLAQISTKTVSPWQPWFVNGQTAGYVEVTDVFTHATVKGAGHETPQYQPLSAYHMFVRFARSGNLTAAEHAPRGMLPRGPRTQSEQLRYMMAKNKLRSW